MNDMSEDILNLVKQARVVLGNILKMEDEETRVRRALVFVLMLQSLEQLTQEITFIDKEGQEEGLKLLDTAIARLDNEADEIFPAKQSPWYNSGNKGDA
jgi:hypothetical protein